MDSKKVVDTKSLITGSMKGGKVQIDLVRRTCSVDARKGFLAVNAPFDPVPCAY